MQTVEHPNRTAPLNREVTDALMDREHINLTPRKAAPRLPRTTAEIDFLRIPTYGQSDCPQICAATYGGKTRHAIVIVSDPACRITCVVPLERLIENGRTIREWFGDPINLDDNRVTPLPMEELHPDLRSQAMTWLAERREEVRAECADFLEDVLPDDVLRPKPHADPHGLSLSSSESQHAA